MSRTNYLAFSHILTIFADRTISLYISYIYNTDTHYGIIETEKNHPQIRPARSV